MSFQTALFSDKARQDAVSLVRQCRRENLALITAEYFTGGLVSACISAVPGAASVFDYGFILMTERAQKTLLSVPQMVLFRQGGVSAPAARAMAEQAARHGAEHAVADHRSVSLAVTGLINAQSGQAVLGGRAHVALALRPQNGSAEMRDSVHEFSGENACSIRQQMVEAVLAFGVATLEELAPRGMGLAT